MPAPKRFPQPTLPDLELELMLEDPEQIRAAFWQIKDTLKEIQDYMEAQQRMIDGMFNQLATIFDQASLNDLALPQISPAQITANQNDYVPGPESGLRLSTDAARNVTGIANGYDGRVIVIFNVGSFNLSLTHQDVLSAAENRIITNTGATVTLTPDTAALLSYDATTLRWRMIA